MLRLFVAVDLPEEIRSRLTGLQSGVFGARWVSSENLHVTLRFIGNVDEGVGHDVVDALARVAAPGFEVSLETVGSFGEGKRPRILWAGVRRSEPLVHLFRKVDRAIVDAGLGPEDRKFRPHVTLARLKDVKREQVSQWIAANNLFSAGPMLVDRFVLYRSHLAQQGAIYEPVAEYPLRPPVASGPAGAGSAGTGFDDPGSISPSDD